VQPADVQAASQGLTICEKPEKGSALGPMAEWLRRGLQILKNPEKSGRARTFDAVFAAPRHA
jgi:hypothetical protein